MMFLQAFHNVSSAPQIVEFVLAKISVIFAMEVNIKKMAESNV